uniref:Hypoxia up-regulated protein 1 n=1 Tax=Clastoptera arizonana TaxID=38151 RepID=A0A1B6CKK6_9HEMI
MFWRSIVFSIGAIVILQCILKANCIAVMSVDLGSEWMKIAIVSPGVPMEIALNKESKRKTPVCISFRNGERTFGEDAETVGVRFPQNSYRYLLDLLGKHVDNPIVKLYQERFPYYDIVPDPVRGTVVFKHDSDTMYSVEELVGMLLNKAKEFAETSAGQPINEVVLTVPGYFNQAERKAILQAAQLAGLKVLQLINDYTAVSLNYGIFRRKDFNESTQYIMFFDMGASSTTATIASYQMVKTKEKGFTETNPQVSILGVGYDRTLGGLEMQLRLSQYLGKKFNEMKKTTKNVFDNPRSVAKLFKEAGRLKTILSANVDFTAQIEGLIDEIDFKLQVTREEFEGLCKDLFDRIKNPIEQAIKSSGITMDVLNQVILVGAGTRVPAVQDRLLAAVKMDLSKNLNTDEAAVLGAVYKAADLSTGFKVKKFITKDAVILPIQVIFERETEGGVKQVKRMLFNQMNPFPQKKILTFNKHLNDFKFSINYAELDHLPEHEVEMLGPLNITDVSLTGVATALEKNLGPNIDSKGIKAYFLLDDSGILSLSNVELLLEKTVTDEELAAQEESPLSKLGSTISKLFTGPEDALKENLEKPVQDEQEETKEQDTSSDKKESVDESGKGSDDSGQKEDVKKNATSKESVDKKKPKVVVIREPIMVEEINNCVHNMLEDQFKLASSKIDALNEYDAQRNRREGALNALESALFDSKTKLEDEEDYKNAATSAEIESVITLSNQLSEWLDEEGFSADASMFETKLEELKKLTSPIWKRVKEQHERPEAIAALLATLNGSRVFLNTIKNMTENQPTSDPSDPQMFTAIEIETLEKVINETQDWLDKTKAEQDKIPAYEPAKLTLKSLIEKMSILDREVKYLVNKAKIWRPKKKEEPAVKEGAPNETSKQEKDQDEETVKENIIEADTSKKEKEQEEETINEADSGAGEKIIEETEAESEIDTKEYPSETKTVTDEDVHTEL